MRKVWVLVANSSLCKIYRAENMGNLALHKTFEHDESHLANRELSSDRLGSMPPSRTSRGTDSMQEPTPARVKEADHFAHQIASYLQKEYNSGAIERLYLIIKPPFLAHLKHCLNENIVKCVIDNIQKDLTHLRPEEIREYLPPVL